MSVFENCEAGIHAWDVADPDIQGVGWVCLVCGVFEPGADRPGHAQHFQSRKNAIKNRMESWSKHCVDKWCGTVVCEAQREEVTRLLILAYYDGMRDLHNEVQKLSRDLIGSST